MEQAESATYKRPRDMTPEEKRLHRKRLNHESYLRHKEGKTRVSLRGVIKVEPEYGNDTKDPAYLIRYQELYRQFRKARQVKFDRIHHTFYFNPGETFVEFAGRVLTQRCMDMLTKKHPELLEDDECDSIDIVIKMRTTFTQKMAAEAIDMANEELEQIVADNAAIFEKGIKFADIGYFAPSADSH